MDENNDIRKNGSGYFDPTAYKAISHVDASETKKQSNSNMKDSERFHKLMNVIFSVCELSGFHLESKIVVRDKKTGRIWRWR